MRLITADQCIGPRDLGGVKPKHLLEILLLNRGRMVSKDRLADLLWGEALPRSPSPTLETYVSVLRRRVSLDGLHGRALIITEPGGYRFAVENVDVDVDRFDRHVVDASSSNGNERRQHLESAAALLRGPLLEDSPFESWAISARQRYDAAAVMVLTEVALAALVDGEFDTALGWSERALASDALVEGSYRLMMLAAYGLHGRTKALSVFERCRAMCRDEVGLDVSPQTAALRESIIRLSPVGVLVDSERREFQSRIRRLERNIGGSHPALCAPALRSFERGTPSGERTLFPETSADRESMQARDTDQNLVTSLAEAIAAEATAGEAVLLIATADHRSEIEAALSIAWPELDLAWCRTLDAERTLQAVLVAGHPDHDRFRTIVGSAVAELVATGRRVSVFAEMIGVLWSRGQPLAAVELIGLWNELGSEHSFSVLCVPPSGSRRN